MPDVGWASTPCLLLRCRAGSSHAEISERRCMTDMNVTVRTLEAPKPLMGATTSECTGQAGNRERRWYSTWGQHAHLPEKETQWSSDQPMVHPSSILFQMAQSRDHELNRKIQTRVDIEALPGTEYYSKHAINATGGLSPRLSIANEDACVKRVFSSSLYRTCGVAWWCERATVSCGLFDFSFAGAQLGSS